MGKKDICEIVCFNRGKVERIKKSMLSEEKIVNLTETFNILSDNTRTKILLSLSQGELCVCDIANVLGLSLSATSHQLRLLRNVGLVKYRSAGRMAFYCLSNKHIIDLIKQVSSHLDKGRL